ncbi:MAG: amidohydrolase family protein [Dehalococcoidia bacterium]|nr:amidohydrolase family protein [Dehalococcoidia bacterium]
MIIDAHTHAFHPAQVRRRNDLCASDATFREMYGDPGAKMVTTDEIVAEMDRAGIDAAVVAGFAFGRDCDLRAQNVHILEAAQEHEGRVIPFATLDLSSPAWRDIAMEALAAGARGFGELRPHNQGWDPLGQEAHELCNLAAERGLVLLWHVSEPVGHTYPGKHGGITPAELCELATAHQETKMIAAHLGGGLPFYVQMPEVRSALRNVWFDTAAAPLLYDDESIARLTGLVGANRVLFGSDFPLLSPKRHLERLRAQLESDEAAAVCGGTAHILFSDRRPS